MKINLIPEWKKLHNFWSVRLAAFLPVLTILQESTQYVRKLFTPRVFEILTALLGVSIIVARVVKQGSLSPDTTSGAPVQADSAATPIVNPAPVVSEQIEGEKL